MNKLKLGLPIAFAVTALALTLVVGNASATHPRPKGATPIRISVAIAYKACASPNQNALPWILAVPDLIRTMLSWPRVFEHDCYVCTGCVHQFQFLR